MASQKNLSSGFPKGFLWGSATAAYQVEGGLENTDWGQAGKEGMVPPAGPACDSYHRYESDFDIAKSLHQNAHRFSIEWVRIEPQEGVFDHSAIEHYRAVIKALKKRGMTPMVTLWHFSLPLWFAQKGGFLASDAVEIFVRYCTFVMKELGEEVDIWITMNEPEVYAGAGYIGKEFPPFTCNPFACVCVVYHLIHAHKRSFVSMKSIRPDARIGIAKHNISFESNANPFNQLLCSAARFLWNRWFLNAIKKHQDFIGLNQYRHWRFGLSHKERNILKRSDIGWEIYPKSIYDCLVDLKRYGLPIYITENGIADAKDTMRAEYIKETVQWVLKAIQEDVPVKGYFHWTLLDNFEWAYGFNQCFGLVEVDLETQERSVRESARQYADICLAHSL